MAVDTDLRTDITTLGLTYVAGIQPTYDGLGARAWAPRPPKWWAEGDRRS